MRQPEQRLYDWLQRKIGHVAMLERVENRVKKDTPDLYLSAQYSDGVGFGTLRGWVELKVLDRFPARAATPVKINHWTTGQRYWALRHRKSGGTTWLVVAVEDVGQVFVFDATELATVGQSWTMADWSRYGQVLDRRNAKAMEVLDALGEFVVQ
jgi:hypothetical protein